MEENKQERQVRNQTLCMYCDRTGCDEHLKCMHYESLPLSLYPCSWIREGVLPDGAKYIEHRSTDGGGIAVTECPLFIGEESKNVDEEKFRLHDKKLRCGPQWRYKVLCRNTGEIFEDAIAASKKYNYTAGYVRKCCREHIKTTRDGLRFEYVGKGLLR